MVVAPHHVNRVTFARKQRDAHQRARRQLKLTRSIPRRVSVDRSTPRGRSVAPFRPTHRHGQVTSHHLQGGTTRSRHKHRARHIVGPGQIRPSPLQRRPRFYARERETHLLEISVARRIHQRLKPKPLLHRRHRPHVFDLRSRPAMLAQQPIPRAQRKPLKREVRRRGLDRGFRHQSIGQTTQRGRKPFEQRIDRARRKSSCVITTAPLQASPVMIARQRDRMR